MLSSFQFIFPKKATQYGMAFVIRTNLERILSQGTHFMETTDAADPKFGENLTARCSNKKLFYRRIFKKNLALN